jgi:hypothetical protein
MAYPTARRREMGSIMTRILATLSILSLALLFAALTMGLSVDDLYAAPSAATLRLATIHRLTGIAAALAVVFVESVVITYFVGTSRWCKEVTETYRLDAGRVAEANRLKRRAFAVALVGMLAVVGIIALGGAADPATGRAGTRAWTVFHLSAAMGGAALIAWTYFAAWQYVWQNHTIIERIVADVAKIRRERGLEPIDASREIDHFSPVQ